MLLFGMSRISLSENLESSSFSNVAGKNSIKARLVVQEKIKQVPKLGTKKIPQPKQRKKVDGHAQVEDRSKREKESGSDEVLAKYLSEIRELILKNKYKKPLASRLNLVGTSKISFKIEMPNTLKDIKLIKSSGKRPLDESAIETVRRVAVIPAIPSDLGLKEITISLEMVFE